MELAPELPMDAKGEPEWDSRRHPRRLQSYNTGCHAHAAAAAASPRATTVSRSSASACSAACVTTNATAFCRSVVSWSSAEQGEPQQGC